MPQEIRVRLKRMIELCRNAFEGGRYEMAHMYMEQLENLVDKVEERIERGLPPAI